MKTEMKNARSMLIGVLLLLHVFTYTASAADDVVIEGLRMLVNGQEFFIKGMCYAPAPLGQSINGGFCSPKLSPFGEVTTCCYDSDYFDGGGDAPDRVQPTEGGWFQPLWRRDFPLIKSLGVNTLRLYNANPTTKLASLYYPEVVPTKYGKDHVPFMDMAQEYGFKVIFPIISDYGMLTSYSETAFKRLIRFQIDELGAHPALLMWGFGNELPIYGNQGLLDLMNLYTAYIKQYTFKKWGRRIPVTTAVVDLPNSYDGFAANMDVDVFTTNAGYRGFTFSDLWSGNGVTQGWHKLSCRYNKPVFIGEIGWHTLNNAISNEHPDWFNQIWKDLVGHIDQGCIGGAFFEYSDEKLKADALQQTMGLVHFTVNTTGGRASTDKGVWNVDVANRKDIIFDAVKSGSYNGEYYNMNSNVFLLAGRTQLSKGSSYDICSKFSLKTCPTDNTCSFHGKCDRQYGTCTCNKGWTGADCSQAVCTDNCSGRGVCVSTVSPPVCNCQSEWTGPSCAVPVTTAACVSNCASGNGVCDGTGSCVCFKGWVGHDCSIPNTNYPDTGSVTAAPTSAPSTTTTRSPTPSTSAPTSAPTTSAPTSAPTTSSPTTSSPTTTTTTTTTRAPTTTTSTAAPTTTKSPPTTTTSSPTTTSTTRAPTTTSTSAPTTSTSAPTTLSTSAPTTPTSTSAPTTTTSTASPSTTSPSTAQASTTKSACDPMKPCGAACYDDKTYSCFSGMLCPIPFSRCGMACFDAKAYRCEKDQLQQL